MIDPTQLTNALRLTSTASLVTGAWALTDSTDYGGIGITSPQTVKVLLKIFDPTGTLFYENAGYAAGVFTSPDLQPINSIPTKNFTLPTDATGAYKTGQYTCYMKEQVVDGSESEIVEKALYQTICNCCNNIKINVNPNVAYNTAVVSIVDNTQYGPFISVSREMTLYPPAPISSQEPPQTTSSQTLVWVPTLSPPNNVPYTGNWTWGITSTITYIDATTQAQTTCLITGQGTFDVEQNQLCKVLCLIKKFRAAFYRVKSKTNGNAAFEELNYVLACAEFTQAIQAERCGRPQSDISLYVAQIYQLLDIDPLCDDCGCNDGTSQPLVPTNSLNGTDGTDGLSFLQGAGVPGSGLGVVGDSYLDSSTGNVYKKTGVSTWTFTISIIGPTGATGATGAAGAAGASGVAVLYNSATNANNGSTTSSFVTLDTYTLPANSLTTNGDQIKIHGVFSLGFQAATGTNLARITFNGNDVFSVPLDFFPNDFTAEIDVRLWRTSNTTVDYEVHVSKYTIIGGTVQGIDTIYKQTVSNFAGLNLTTTGYAINAQVNSGQASNISIEALEVTFYKKS